MTKIKQEYLYLISHVLNHQELCEMEMRYIFNNSKSTKYHITTEDINVSRSTFIRGKVTILYRNTDFQDLKEEMLADNLKFDMYKIHFVKIDEVPYQDRLISMRALGFTIEGSFAMSNPLVEFVLTKIEGEWIFGLYQPNPNNWIKRKQKPFNYSNALEVKVAKAIINIAINNNFGLKLIDPCCGIGTVLIEGREMGIDIKGYEINPLVKLHCNSNLEYFGFTGDVPKIDMHFSDEHFDVAILDLPYGQFSLTTKEKQISLIKKTTEIADKSLIISMEDISEIVSDLGLKVIDSCIIKKTNNFQRYISICE